MPAPGSPTSPPGQVAAELPRSAPSSVVSLVGLGVAVAVLGNQVQGIQTQLGTIQAEVVAVRLSLASANLWTRPEQETHRRDVEEQLRAVEKAQHELRARLTALEQPRR